jgi:predicted nucleic acid-binding protein
MLIDTNILVYSVDNKDLEKQARAQQLLRELQARDWAYLSVQNLSEYASIALRKLQFTPQEIKGDLDRFQNAFTVFPMTPAIPRAALDGIEKHLSFYDAQLWALARAHGLKAILTEDGSSGSKVGGIAYVNVFQGSLEQVLAKLEKLQKSL